MRAKTKLGFVVAGLCLVGSTFCLTNEAKAGNFTAYSRPPYICSTGVGCCDMTKLPTQIESMFRGTGLYSTGDSLQKKYYVESLWPKVETALKKVADEARNVELFEIGPRGAFIDAQTLTQSITSIDKQRAQSVVTEMPSEQICRIGTLSRSLAKSEDKSRIVQLGLATQMLQREVMRSGTAAGTEDVAGKKIGRTSDVAARQALYDKVYCNPKDSNNSAKTPACTAASDIRQNRDIDTSRSLYSPLTLKLDFSDGATAAKTDDEIDVMALASNLYSHSLPIGFGVSDFEAILKDNGQESDSRKEKLMDYRSMVAKRTVAQNSFAALAAMKAEGSGGSSTYMKQVVGDLGLKNANPDEQLAYLGANPSYYAQMELLTRKLYQTPSFYANLIESPANVARQQSAMEAIGLMQDRDTYESLRRSEMVLSSLLEMYLVREQDKEKDKGTK